MNFCNKRFGKRMEDIAKAKGRKTVHGRLRFFMLFDRIKADHSYPHNGKITCKASECILS